MSEGTASGSEADIAQNRLLLAQVIIVTTIVRLIFKFFATKQQRLATRRIAMARKLQRDGGSKRRQMIIECYIEMQTEKIVFGRSLYQEIVVRNKAKQTESAKDYKQTALAMRSLRELAPFIQHVAPFLAFEFVFRKSTFVVAKFDHCINPKPFEAMWSWGAMGRKIACDELNGFWVMMLWSLIAYPILRLLIVGHVHHVPFQARMDMIWMAKEMAAPAFQQVDLTGNEDLLVHLPDILDMEESALFNE